MKSISIISLILLTSSCYLNNNGSIPNDAGGDTQVKQCKTPNAMYAVVFKELSGNCPNIDDRVSYVWLDENGKPNLPSNCNDNSDYNDVCTTFESETCYTWVYKEELSGELDWSPSGNGAHGYLTFAAFERQNDYLFCSSVYETTYTKQWQSK